MRKADWPVGVDLTIVGMVTLNMWPAPVGGHQVNLGKMPQVCPTTDWQWSLGVGLLIGRASLIALGETFAWGT